MKIGGSHKNISYETKFKNSIYSFEETDVPILEKILETAPKVTHNFNQYKANLDTLQTQISTLQFERRINSLKEYGISTLQILGIIALGLGTIYVMYKCKLFECLRRSFPKNVRIKILCPTARVNRIDQTSTVPRTVTFQNITEDEDEGIIQLRSPTRAYALAEQSEAKEGGMSRWS
ncbi:uncharacterized protein LOC117215507 [Bombus bifarius]|uniref:Uncharacterized protein LOC117215507 n=1 Tax=Bombus bifarius TaxID=103933 RepID=A0A6P8NTP2_9HYME|nr:uncharacterized protein LOC117215507 [Bombus bifarius]